MHSFILIGVFSVAGIFGLIGKVENGDTGLILPYIISDIFILAFLAVVVAVSHISYELVELPGQRLGKKLYVWVTSRNSSHVNEL